MMCNIYIYIYIWPPVKKKHLVHKYKLFLGRPYCFTVFCSNQRWIKKMQRTWLHGFRSPNCRGWIKERSLSLRLQPCWGAIWSYLSTFLGYFPLKEICCNLNSELEKGSNWLRSMIPRGLGSLILWKWRMVTSPLSLFEKNMPSENATLPLPKASKIEAGTCSLFVDPGMRENLVSGIPTPLKNMRQWGVSLNGQTNVPNHQPL